MPGGCGVEAALIILSIVYKLCMEKAACRTTQAFISLLNFYAAFSGPKARLKHHKATSACVKEDANV